MQTERRDSLGPPLGGGGGGGGGGTPAPAIGGGGGPAAYDLCTESALFGVLDRLTCLGNTSDSGVRSSDNTSKVHCGGVDLSW